MLLPIGRDDSEIQRHAYVSYAIIALNILVFVATSMYDDGAQQRVIQQRARLAVTYFVEHPYLVPPPELLQVASPREQAMFRRVQHVSSGAPSEGALQQQAELQRLTNDLEEALEALPIYRWGYRPAKPSAVTMFTSMFLHGGFMHLLGNLLFFFVTGPFLEDVFGRPLFAFLYFSGGVLATLAYATHFHDSGIPLIGASGAIAAVMGAYLVRFLRSRMEFIGFFISLRPHHFFLPAYVVLPFWFVEQIFYAMLSNEASGTAFLAHIAGFSYGVVFAFVVALTGFEASFVAPVVAKQTTWAVDESLNEALAAKHAGNFDAARTQIRTFLAKSPDSVEGLRLAIEIGIDAEDEPAIDQHAARLFEQYVAMNEKELAIDLAHELTSDRTDLRLPRFIGRVAQHVERTDYDWALALYQRLCQMDPNSAGTVRNIMKMGALLRAKGNPDAARRAYETAKRHPACSVDWKPAIEAKLGQLGS